MENEIKSVSDIIAEISKKDKKRQVFILTNLINQLKSTRIEANSNYEDCKLSYTRRTDNYIGNFKLMLFKKQRDVNVIRIRKLIEMQNGEIIPMLIARIKQNNTDNMVIRSKLYSLLTDITNKFDEVIRAVPRIEDFQNMSNEQVLEHYYLSVGAESLWDSRELIMKAISEHNKLIREEYEKPKEASKETIKDKG